jgi:hypothetical protein
MRIKGYIRSDFRDWIKWHDFTKYAISKRQPKNQYLGFPRIYKKKPKALTSNFKKFVKVDILLITKGYFI